MIHSTETSSETREDLVPKTWSYLREENSCGFKHFRGGSPIFQVFCHRLWQHLVDQLFRPGNGIAECWLLIPHLFFCFFKSISLARRAKDRIWRAFTAFLDIKIMWHIFDKWEQWIHKPDEKYNYWGDEDERDKNDNSQSVIFVHCPNLHPDVFLKVCVQYRQKHW